MKVSSVTSDETSDDDDLDENDKGQFANYVWHKVRNLAVSRTHAM
jgi:hypothetical protein